VAELYLSAPHKSLDKPAEELKGFAKTGLLQPGASETLTFTLNADDLASFYTEKSAWVADSGDYTVKIGASSADIKLSKTFKLPKEILVQKVHKALSPKQIVLCNILEKPSATAGGFLLLLDCALSRRKIK
jgi:beta-glucosidase